MRVENVVIMTWKLPQRWLFLAGFGICVGLIGGALYFQHGVGLEPCPLCIVQRVIVMGLGVLMLLGAIHNPGVTGRRAYGVLAGITAALGLGVAGRHVWLQNLPADQLPECGPSLDYILDAFPLAEALKLVLQGSGECAEVQWSFLGLTIPGWTLVVFTGFFVFALIIVLSRAQPAQV